MTCLTVSHSWAFENGGWGDRSRVKLVEVEGGSNEPEQYPSPDDDENGSISQLVEPEQEALFSHVQLHCLLCEGHGFPVIMLGLIGQSICDPIFLLLLPRLPPHPSPEPDLDPIWRCYGRWWHRWWCVVAAVAGGGDCVVAAAFAFDGYNCGWLKVAAWDGWGDVSRGSGERFRNGDSSGVHGFESCGAEIGWMGFSHPSYLLRDGPTKGLLIGWEKGSFWVFKLILFDQNNDLAITE